MKLALTGKPRREAGQLSQFVEIEIDSDASGGLGGPHDIVTCGIPKQTACF